MKLLWEIFNGVRYFHSYNSIPKDLTPQNIFVLTDLHFKICEFSRMKQIFRSKIGRVTNGDTQLYMVTESFEPEIVMISKSDVWSLSYILIDMIMKQNDFQYFRQ
jgi:serine/threonine protein kinase